MPWSTRELAELAGTILRTVRHYHDLGLLDAPARGVNGYKQYDVGHLRRLLRIRRLVASGLTLPQVGRALGPHGLSAAEVRDLDHRITDTVQRLQAAREELAALVRNSDSEVHHDLGQDPDELAALDLPRADDDFLAVLTAVVSPATKDAYLDAVRTTADAPALCELDTLDADADEETRTRLAERVDAHVRDLHAGRPALRDVLTGSALTRTTAHRTLADTMRELYNPAQIDVMHRVAASAARRARALDIRSARSRPGMSLDGPSPDLEGTVDDDPHRT